jgi:hypothetical protein
METNGVHPVINPHQSPFFKVGRTVCLILTEYIVAQVSRNGEGIVAQVNEQAEEREKNDALLSLFINVPAVTDEANYDERFCLSYAIQHSVAAEKSQ